MKRETFFLKVAVFLIGLPVLAICIAVFPELIQAVNSNTEWPFPERFFIVFLYVTSFPFYFFLYQSFKLLRYIDENKAFSELTVKGLKTMKVCAFTISILYVSGIPIFHMMAVDPPVPLIATLIAFVSFMIAVFVAILQKLLKNAIDIKSENDLTI
ncbi:DUF2975 domain-containing protein [Marininema halotolerans]|uniref:DUF2975 domain-containing protein n=1 Tax=Marininema halotolerans TaxID=1155944 RepID=A0A1I6R983_9BACL|nr:DUF2975 domain-containing protein [Marininema halotolerans]SFS61088.1 Protein of unknown function [Marininema halotolerans]